MPPRKRAPVGSALTATRRVLRELNAKEVAPAHAAAAEKLATTIDATTAARDLSALVKELRAVLAEAEAINRATVKQESAVDDLATRRAQRLAAAEDSERPTASQ